MNPLLTNSKHSFEAIDFDKIKVEHFLPALNESIKEAKIKLEKIKQEKNITFDSIIVQEECSADQLDQVVDIFYALYSAHCSEELTQITEEFNAT